MKKLFLLFLISLFCSQKSFSQINANQIKWVDGANITNQASSYGASTNGPGARFLSVEWELNGKLYLFGGSGQTATTAKLNDLWVYDPATNNWTWLKGYNGTTVPNSSGSYGTIGVPLSTNLPLGRSSAMGWTLNNKLYLIGGTDGSVLYNDLWEYDTVTNNWTWIKGSNTPSNAGNYGTIGVEASTNIPGARLSSANWVANGKFYLFGGYGKVNGLANGYLNDLWSYNPATNNWTYIKGSMALNTNGTYGSMGVANTSNTPGGRLGGNAWVYNNKLYLMGGLGIGDLVVNNDGNLGDLWAFDISTNNWTWLRGSDTVNPPGIFGTIGVANANNSPAGKSYASTWTYNSKLYLFGAPGSGINPTQNDLWEYNPSTNNWTWLKGANSGNVPGQYGSLGVTTNTNLPGGRYGGLSWVYNNKLYLFGGLGLATTATTGFLNDLWEYDPMSNNFTWIKGRNDINKPGIYNALMLPGARAGAKTWEIGSKIYLFGGFGKNENGENKAMNDLWEYNPNTNTWLWLKGSKFGNQMGIYGTKGVEDSQNTPGGRFNYSNWTYNNKLYLHAGEGQVSDPFGDLWMYNPTTNNWAFLKGFQHAGPFGTVYGTKGVEAAPNQPGRRTSCASWTYNNKLYLYGGGGSDVNSNSGILSDIWEYNPATNNWMWSNGSNLVGQPLNFNFLGNGIADPGNRFNQTTWLHENFVYLFGGNSNLGLLNDTWKYNLNSNVWLPLNFNINQNQAGIYGTQGVPASTNTPGGRYNTASWTYNKKLYLMGGYGYGNNATFAGNLNDLWEYKPTTNVWTWLKGSFSTEQGGNYGTLGTYSSTNIPGSRAGSSNFIFNNKLYLFGGYGFGSGVGEGYLNDLWEYTPTCTESYSVASGNWNTTNTWFCNKVPTATEVVSIYGHTIDLTGNGYAKSVFYNPTGTVRIGVGGNLILNP